MKRRRKTGLFPNTTFNPNTVWFSKQDENPFNKIVWINSGKEDIPYIDHGVGCYTYQHPTNFQMCLKTYSSPVEACESWYWQGVLAQHDLCPKIGELILMISGPDPESAKDRNGTNVAFAYESELARVAEEHEEIEKAKKDQLPG